MVIFPTCDASLREVLWRLEELKAMYLEVLNVDPYSPICVFGGNQGLTRIGISGLIFMVYCTWYDMGDTFCNLNILG